MTQVKLKHVEGKSFVDVNATVAQAKKVLENSNEVTLVARQSQISRIGMIIKTVEQQCGCNVTRLVNENKTETVDDRQGKRDVPVLYFRATLTKK